MHSRQTRPHFFRAAAAAMVGFAMACGLLILFGGMAQPAVAAPSAIDHGGTITTDTTWYAVDNPHVVTTTVVVTAGTLTLEPGVVVSFTNGTAIIVQAAGHLIANGTPGQGIQFTSNPDTCYWQGIQLYSDRNEITYASFEYARYAIKIEVGSDLHTIAFNTFRQNGGCTSDPLSGAIVGSTDNSIISDNVFNDNNTAIYLSKSSENLVARNVISGTDEVALSFYPSAGTRSSDNIIISNTIHHAGGYGIYMTVGDNNSILENQVYSNQLGGIGLEDQRATIGNALVVRNNDVYSNTGPGLYITDTMALDLDENLIWDNSQGVLWGLSNLSFGYSITRNVICRNADFLFSNTDTFTVTAAPNWWGTNNPSMGGVGSDIQGSVEIDPRIVLTATPGVATLPANGVSTTTITITLRGGGVTVPARARTISLDASPGIVSPPTITLDANGEGTATYAASTTPGPVVVTVTDMCASIPVTLSLVLADADVGIRKTGPGGSITPGELVTYTITYSNAGPAPATDVVITDALPAGTTYLTDTSGLPVTIDTNVITWTAGTLNGGASDTFQIVLSTDAGICGGPLANTASITTTTHDRDPSNDRDTDSSVDPICYNLAITKTARVSWAVPGQTVTYTIEYSNTEPYTATGVVITDALPISTTYTGSSLSPSGSSTGLVTWTLNTLGPNSGGSLVLSATIDSDVPCGQWITNTTYIDGDGGEANSGDNSDSAAIEIRCGVNLVVLKNDHVGTGDPRLWVWAGDYITYTISVNNMGNQTATNVVLTEVLPANTTFVGPTGANGWFQVGSSNLYTYQVGTLYGIGGPGSNGTVVDFVVQVDPYLPCSITETVNTVLAVSDQPELYLADNTSNEQTPVQCSPVGDLRVHKDDGVFCASPGQTITYTITYSNVGTSIINDVVLTDTHSEYADFLLGGLNALWTPVGGRVYTRSVGAVGPGGPFGPLYFQVQLLDSTTFPTDVTTITNVIQISGGYTDVEETWVPNVPDLVIAKNDNIGVTTSEYAALYRRVVGKSPPLSTQAVDVGPGDTIEYTIVYVNNGRATATGVVLTDTLPLYTSYAGGTAWTPASGSLYTHTVGNLDPGQGGFLTFWVQVDSSLPPGLEWIVNRVEIGGDQLGDECNLGNNVSYEQTPVRSGVSAPTNVYLPIIIKNYPEAPPAPTPAPLGWVSDVVVDPATDRVFVASPRQDAVHVIDGLVDEYSTSVAVGHGPTGLAVLTSTSPSKVFVVHAYDWTPTLWFIDASTLARHSMADQSGYLGSYPYKVAVNSVTDRAFVSNWHDQMPIVNASSETFLGWVQKKNYQKSYGIDVSQRSNLVYMATIDTGELIIFDADQAENNSSYGACHHAPLEPRVLRTVAVNEATGHVFVASPPDFNKGQTNSQVLVLDEDTLLAWTSAHGGRPSDTTCLWNFGITGKDISIAAIPGPAWVAAVDLTGAVSAGEEGIAVNPVTGRVYVTDGPGDKLFVLQDSITPTNISLVTNVAVGDNPQGVDVNPETNRVYVANAGGSTDPYGTVSVVNGTTNVVTKTIVLGP